MNANQLSGLFFILFKPNNVGKIVISIHNTNFDMAQETDSFLKWIFYQPLIWLEKIVYQRADGLLFNSPDEEKALKNYYNITILTKSVYLGVDLPNISKNEKVLNRRNLGFYPNQKIVLYLGRLVKR